MNFSTTTTVVHPLLYLFLLYLNILSTSLSANNHIPPTTVINSCDYLINPGFETGTAQGWNYTNRANVNQQYVGEGRYGAYVERGKIYQDIPYAAGCAAYELKVYSGIHDYDDYDQIVFVQFLDSNGNILLTKSAEVTNYVEDGPLQEYDLFATPPAGTATVRVGADSKNGRYVKLDAFCLSGTCAPPCSVNIDQITATDCALGQYSADVTFSFTNATGEVMINGCTFLPSGTSGVETFKLMNLPCDGVDQQVQVQFVNDASCQAQTQVVPPCPKPRFCVGTKD